MYIPTSFQVQEIDAIHDFLRAHPLGLLISVGGEGPVANLIPFYLDAARGVLRAHLSKANSQWSQIAEHSQVLVVFQGPQTYVTPSWYPSKQQDGKVVPTWNYSTVQVRGSARVNHEVEWLLAHVNELTDYFEQDRSKPWSVADAPEAYIKGQLKGIVGLEITVESWQGKLKMSQNRSAEDRIGVRDGLLALGRKELATMVCPAQHA